MADIVDPVRKNNAVLMTSKERLAWLEQCGLFIKSGIALYLRAPFVDERPSWIDEPGVIKHVVIGDETHDTTYDTMSNRIRMLRMLFACSFDDVVGNTTELNPKIVNICRGRILSVPSYHPTPVWSCFVRLLARKIHTGGQHG